MFMDSMATYPWNTQMDLRSSDQRSEIPCVLSHDHKVFACRPRQNGMIRFTHATLISRMNRVMADFNQVEGHLWGQTLVDK
jgi:hypothetical protein